MTRTHLASLLAAAGLASAAPAQVNWTTQFQFAQSTSGPGLTGNTLSLTAIGTYTFILRAGIFNLTGLGPGQSNQGLFDWKATAHATGLQPGETLGVDPATSRRLPFDYGPATTFGGTLADPSTITNIDCARDVAGGAAAWWAWDTATGVPPPLPTAPSNSVLGTFAPAGINSYANVWRFTVAVNSLAGPDIAIRFTGQAGPVIQWLLFGSVPPDDTTPGWARFLGLTPTPILRDHAPGQLTLTRIPSPPGALALGLGLLLIARRRRSPPPC